jgi:transposase
MDVFFPCKEMYIKRSKIRTKSGLKEYLALAESYREGGKVKQKTVLSLGCADDLDEKEIGKMILGLGKLTESIQILEGKKEGDGTEGGDPDIRIYESRNYGVPLVIDFFWKKLQMRELTEKVRKRHPQLGFDFDLTFRAAVIHRLIAPGSERSMLEWFRDVYLPGTEKIGLQHLYRSVTLVNKYQSEIESHLFDLSRTLFGIDCSLVFYDTTTTYFEGDGIDNEALKQYGHSKDHRPDRKQVKVGIVMSRDGIPVCPQIFSGDESDVKTVPTVLKKLDDLRKQQDIGELVFVGDSGMMSSGNRKELEEKKMKYILGARMRNTKSIREEVLDIRHVSALKDKEKNLPFRIKKNLFAMEKKIGEDRYIICYNPEEAKKGKALREDILAKLESEIKSSPKKYMKHRLYKRFLRITEVKTEIDATKIEEEEKYDGIFVIETNTSLSAEEVAIRYKDLLLVEQAFRCLKSTLDVRPVYHQTSENIQGHIFISYLSLYFFCLILRELEKDEKELPCEEKQIIRSLSRLLAHDTENCGQKFVIRSEIDAVNRNILASLGIKTPQRVLKRIR